MTYDQENTENENSGEESEKKSNFENERKATLGFFGNLLRYSPTGGSIGLVLNFVLNNELLNALFTFPFMIGAVAWAAYSKSFLLQIQEIYDQRGKDDANSLIAQVERLDKVIKKRKRKETYGWKKYTQHYILQNKNSRLYTNRMMQHVLVY